MPVPPQYKEAEVVDFRNATLGPRGYKMSRKRTIEAREDQVLYQSVMSLISRPSAQHSSPGVKATAGCLPSYSTLNLFTKFTADIESPC